MEPPEEKTARSHPHHLGNRVLLDPLPLPSEFPLPSVGEGVGIFSGTTRSQKTVACEYSHFSLFLAAWVVSPGVTPSLQAKRPYSGKEQGVTAVRGDGDGDGDENHKNAIGLISKTTTLHVHHTFLYISLTSLHDYDMKMPNFTFYGSSMKDVDKRRRIFLPQSF